MLLTTEELQYPIGRFEPPDPVTHVQVIDWIRDIAAMPADLRRTVSPLTDEQLDTPYRPLGWTVRQVVHHLADSHMNSLVRFKWALTEDRPVIKAYDERRWATLPDCRGPVAASLDLLDALHQRWANLLFCLDCPNCSESSFIQFRARRHWRLQLGPMLGMVDITWRTSASYSHARGGPNNSLWEGLVDSDYRGPPLSLIEVTP